MKSNRIKLIDDVREDGSYIYKSYVTRPNISFGLIYESANFLAEIENKATMKDLDVMIDLVTRAYNNQFDKDSLLKGLESDKALTILFEQIVFIASGQIVGKVDTDVSVEEDVGSWKEHKDNLNNVLREMVKEGSQDINNILDMPFYFVVDELAEEKAQVKKSESMLDAFA